MAQYKETYITIEDFGLLQNTGRQYEGFVIGLGYAYVDTSVSPPPNLRGYTNFGGYVPPKANRFSLIRFQYVDNSPEMVEMSKKGTVSKDEYYTVKKGDTLSAIAARFKVTVDDIVKWNRVANPNKIEVGQRLVIGKKVSKTSDDSNNSQQVLETVSKITNITSAVTSTIVFKPSNVANWNLYKNNQFSYQANGIARTAKNNFFGNQYVSSSEVALGKVQFGKNISYLKNVKGVGVGASTLGIGIGGYQIVTGQADATTYVDTGVGTVGLGAAVAPYFTGVEIPYVGEFVFVYGVCRLTWDTFYDLGAKYGPSKWYGNDDTKWFK